MRKVVLDIDKLGLSVGDTIGISLVDKMGNIATQEHYYNKNFIIQEPLFKCELFENDLLHNETFYQLTLPSKAQFNFRVHASEETAPLDMFALFSLECYESIIRRENEKLVVVDAKFVSELEKYFRGESFHFTPLEQNLVNLYENYYAQEIRPSTRTIDAVALLDRYLSQKGMK